MPGQKFETGHQDVVNDVAMDYYGKRLATASSDNTIKIIGVSNSGSQHLAALTGHQGPVWQVAWAHPKFGSLLASCSYDGNVIIWKEANQNEWIQAHVFADHKASVNSISWAPHELGLILACGSSDGNISVFTAGSDDSWDKSRIDQAHPTGVTSVSWAPSTAPGALVGTGLLNPVQKLASGGCDNTVKVWKFDNGSWRMDCFPALKMHTDWVRDVSWAPNLGLPKSIIASASEDGKVIIWSAVKEGDQWDGQILKDFGCPVWRVTWSLTGNILAVADGTNNTTLWQEVVEGEWQQMAPKIESRQDPENKVGRKRARKAFDTVSVKKDSLIYTTCTLRGVAELVQSLNERQRADVEAIGFGGLLSMRLTRLNRMLVTWLVNCFNGRSRMLTVDRFRSFAITADDVFDIFMLPRGKLDVVKFGKSDIEDNYVMLKDNYGIESRSTVKSLYVVLTSRFPDGGEDFKRLFVVYVMSVFLAPSSNRLVSLSFLRPLMDVGNIRNYDWCNFVLERICESVNNYHTGKTTCLNCCVIVLQMVYLHRFKWQGIEEPRSLPLIQHWTDDKMDSRCDEEAEAGPYGDAEMLVNVFPISKDGNIGGVGGEAAAVNVGDDTGAAVGNDDDSGPSVAHKDANEEGGRFIKFVLPEGEPDDNDIRKMAKDATHESFLLFQRDISVVTKYHMEKLLGVKKDIEEKLSSTPPEDTGSQAFFSDAALHSYIDTVVENFLAMNKLASEMPSFEILSPEDRAGPSNLHEEEVVTEINELGPFWSISEEVGYVSEFMINSNKYLNDLNQIQKEVVDYCLFMDGREDEELFRKGYFNFITKGDMMSLSPKVEIYQSVLSCWNLIVNAEAVSNGRRSRFVFGLEHSRNVEKILNGSIVDENEKEIKACWDAWIASNDKSTLLHVDMIFVPFCLEGHYATVVVNFVDKKFQYLDNRRYQGEENTFYRSALILKTQLSKFLESRKHPKAKEMIDYEFEMVIFRWTTTNKDLDCGVYVMHHVRNFNGLIYSSPDMTKATVRRALRASICATLILSDINELRTKVTEDVYAFYKGKPELKNKLKEKKNADHQKKKAKTLNELAHDRRTRQGKK